METKRICHSKTCNNCPYHCWFVTCLRRKSMLFWPISTWMIENWSFVWFNRILNLAIDCSTVPHMKLNVGFYTRCRKPSLQMAKISFSQLKQKMLPTSTLSVQDPICMLVLINFINQLFGCKRTTERQQILLCLQTKHLQPPFSQSFVPSWRNS